MKNINVMAFLRKAGKKTISTKQAYALFDSRGYARLALSRLKKRGALKPVRNGWWALSDASAEEVACEISAPCYISFHSALYLAGMTTQIPGSVQVAILRQRPRTYRVFGTVVREIRLKNREEFRSFAKTDGIVCATTPKATADCLNYPRTCPQTVVVEALERVGADEVEPLLSKGGKKRFRRLMRRA